MAIALILAAAASLQTTVGDCPAFPPPAQRMPGGPVAYTVMGSDRVPPPTRHTPVPSGPVLGVSMKLRRSNCFGTCPAYTVEVKGDGEIRFSGDGFVLLSGERDAHIDPVAVGCLLDDFRRADFWSLSPRYAAHAYDLPTYEVTLSVGGQTKSVVDYAGRMVGMPEAVTDLERALDSAAGTGRWIAGDTGLVDWLTEDGFDFHSKDAASLALSGVRDASDDTLVQLVERGAPLETSSDSSQPNSRHVGAELLRGAILNGKTALFRKLVERGWLRELGLAGANEALAEGSAGCQPTLVDAAADAGLSIDATTPAPAASGEKGAEAATLTDEAFGQTALASLATDYRCQGEEVRMATGARLLARGANPNIRNSKGETSIFGVENIDFLNLLLSHGADVSVRDNKGNSAIFSSWTDAIDLRLLEAGASPEGHYFDGATLKEQAKAHGMLGVQHWMEIHEPPQPKS